MGSCWVLFYRTPTTAHALPRRWDSREQRRQKSLLLGTRAMSGLLGSLVGPVSPWV